MAKPADSPKPSPTDAMTAERAAALVDIPVETLFAFRDYGTHVIVVTVQGHKLDSRDVENWQ